MAASGLEAANELAQRTVAAMAEVEAARTNAVACVSQHLAAAFVATVGVEGRKEVTRQFLSDVKAEAGNPNTGRTYVAEIRNVLNANVARDVAESNGLVNVAKAAEAHFSQTVMPSLIAKMSAATARRGGVPGVSSVGGILLW
jgi:hypothetical protein